MANRIALTGVGVIALIVVAGLVFTALMPPAASKVEASGLNLPPAQTTTDSTSGILVSGMGTVHVKPNIATTSIGLETTAATLAEATSQSNTKMTAINDKLKSLGVADKDIQTTAYNVVPVTNSPRQGETPKITGYRVINQVSVTIRKLDDAGKILDAVVAAGANNIYGINFGIDDPTAAQQQARAAAIKDAQDKAAQLAKAAGITLGKVISISEGTSVPRPVLRAGGVMAADAASVPIEAGQLDITVNVDMRFAVQ